MEAGCVLVIYLLNRILLGEWVERFRLRCCKIRCGWAQNRGKHKHCPWASFTLGVLAYREMATAIADQRMVGHCVSIQNCEYEKTPKRKYRYVRERREGNL